MAVVIVVIEVVEIKRGFGAVPIMCEGYNVRGIRCSGAHTRNSIDGAAWWHAVPERCHGTQVCEFLEVTCFFLYRSLRRRKNFPPNKVGYSLYTNSWTCQNGKSLEGSLLTNYEFEPDFVTQSVRRNKERANNSSMRGTSSYAICWPWGKLVLTYPQTQCWSIRTFDRCSGFISTNG